MHSILLPYLFSFFFGTKTILLLPPLPDTQNTAEARIVEAELRKAFEAFPEPKVRVLEEWVPQEKDRPADIDSDLSQAKQSITAGREHLLQLALDEAIDAFQTGRFLYRKHFLWLDDPEELIVSLMGLAEALSTQGQPGLAEEAYREILELSPDYLPDPRYVSSELRLLFEKVRTQVQKQPKGNLKLDSIPRGARIVLNGLKIGTTPLEKRELVPGSYSLHLDLEGYQIERLALHIAPNEATEQTVTLKPLKMSFEIDKLQAIAGKDLPNSWHLLEGFKKQAANLSLDALLWFRLEEQVIGSLQVHFVLVPLATPNFFWQIQEPYVFSEEALLSTKLVTWVLSSLTQNARAETKTMPLKTVLPLADPGKPLQTDLAQPKPSHLEGVAFDREKLPAQPFWQTWWFWSSVTAVLVLSGTTLALAFAKDRGPSEAQDLIFIEMERIRP